MEDTVERGDRRRIVGNNTAIFPESPHQFDLLAGRFRLYFEGLSSVGTWRSLVAHLLWEQRVAGSNPAVPTIKIKGLRIPGP